MARFPLLVLPVGIALLSLACADTPLPSNAKPVAVGASDWPWWRGPNHDGLADPKQSVPQKWSDTENVLWHAPIPGRGHGSPIVVGSRVVLCTADVERKQELVLCFDRETGKELWRTVVHEGVEVPKKLNRKDSLASSTPACDGSHLFVNFLANDAVYATALDLDGKRLWQQKISDFVVHQGFGSSPAIYKNLVIFSADNKGGGAIVALHRDTGKEVWRHDRPKLPNYASPIILTIAGKDQLILTGTDLVTSLDPLTGQVNWEAPGATTECVTSVVTDGRRVFTTGGYPKNHVAAMRADGSGKVEWETKTRVYVPSLFVRAGHVYAVQDAGIATCWKSDTGEEVWSERLGGGFSASPVPVGEVVYATNEAGKTYVFRATPDDFQILAENQLGEEVMATPTICGGRIYLRVAFGKGANRKEQLYCIGEK